MPSIEMEIRGCFTISDYKEIGEILKWEPESRQFIGRLGYLGNLHFDVLSRVSKNITWDQNSGSDEVLIGGKYSGCLGRLQNNLSDVTPFEYHVNYLKPGLSIGKVTFSDPMVAFYSAYDPLVTSRKSDIMHTIGDVSLGVWTSCLVLGFMISILMTVVITAIRSCRKNAIRPSVKTVLRLFERTTTAVFKHQIKLFVKQSADDGYGLKRFPFKFMVFAVILLAFYSSFFVTAIIKTSASTLQPPKTVETYDDIINSVQVRPMWDKKTGGEYEFKDAGLGTKKRLIWEKAFRMGINKSYVGSGFLTEFSALRAVTFNRSNYRKLVFQFMCKLMAGSTVGTLPLMREDKVEVEMLYMNMKSAHMNKRLAKAIDQKYQRIAEAGYKKIVIQEGKRTLDLDTEQENCASNRVSMPDPGPNAINLWQLRLLLIGCATVITIALIIYLSEILTHRYYK